MKSQSLLLTAPRSLVWEESTLPDPQPHEVLIQTQAGAISLGSELPLYTGLARRTDPLLYPMMTGYESLGVVLRCGQAVTHLPLGARVLAFYGHRTHWVMDARHAIAVPPAISAEQALLANLTCDVTKGIRTLALTPEQHVVISGAGAIGLLTLAMLRAYGVQRIDVVEPLAHRQAIARQWGAHHTWTPEEFAHVAQQYPLALECSSSDAAFHLVQAHMAHGGRICILADGNREALSLAPAFHERELRVVGSSDGWDYAAHAAWYFTWLQAAPMPLADIFEERVSSDALPHTFARLAAQSSRPLKVLVAYQPSP